MTPKPFPWRKLTPAQVALMERLAAANEGIAISRLEYRELLALDELQKLGFAESRANRRKLQAFLTPRGRELKADAYRTDLIILRITGPQIDLLTFLKDGPIEDSVGQPMTALSGAMYDVCRRMTLRGWAEWYSGWNGKQWARLTPAGFEVLDAVGAHEHTVIQFDTLRRRRGTI